MDQNDDKQHASKENYYISRLSVVLGKSDEASDSFI